MSVVSRQILFGSMALVLVSSIVAAADPVQPRPEVTPQESPVPDVVIREAKDGSTIKEWRQNGKVLAIKVQPKNAPEYYLVDPDGDGIFNLDPNFDEKGLVAQWVLFRF